MLDHVKIKNLNDFFTSLSGRKEKGVFFYRINGYNEEIDDFIHKYYEASRKNGVVIEGRIPNPDDNNLSYYSEMMGMDFQLSLEFISVSLKKWLPRMNDYQRETVSAAIYKSLNSLKEAGKNENMLKNAYIKFMCWLYYKFERIVSQLGNEEVPKILYEADISNYELMLISILSNAGCDVVLLQYNGDADYLKLDQQSGISDDLVIGNMRKFPEGYSLKKVGADIQEDHNNEMLYGTLPRLSNCTNAWITGKNVLDDIKTAIQLRSKDSNFYYNCFCRVNGVEDRLTYLNDLYNFGAEIKNSSRKLIVVNGEIPVPTMEEINLIQRRNTYQRQDQMLIDLSNNIRCPGNIELQRIINKAFLDVALKEAKKEGMNLNRLTNKCVYLICWLKRYVLKEFSDWKESDIGCFIHMGACKSENEVLFMKLLGRLPLDVLILVPNLNEKCLLEDELLYEQNYTNSLNADKFPIVATDLQVGTMAYHAERELDTLLYQNSGFYRNQQFSKANAINLRTMYEEIQILWKEELKYRPNFGTTEGVVNVPVILSKVSGVKNGDINAYWNSIKELMDDEVFLNTTVPYIEPNSPNPIKAYATEFYKNGRLLRNKIKEHKSYQYAYLREEMQEHILDKLQLLIDQKLIKGTFENGTEYTIIATVLNLDKDLIRMLQSFDFTRTNPKLVYINVTEKMISLEDSIVVAFLNLIGFDIVFFVPTGYQSIEKYFNRNIFEEHQIGEYVYDLQIPDLKLPPTILNGSWRNIFKRR